MSSTAGPPAGSTEVTAPEETARSRALRTDFLEGRIGDLGTGHVPLSQDGILYRVWFRDTLPFENPSGVVRPTM